jgi:addiction module HigA family antidote
MLLEEFLNPLEVTQVQFADALGIPFQRLNQIIKGKRSVTPDTALRLAKVLGTSVDVWLNLQLAWDLYAALRSPKAKQIDRLRPLEKSA